jgi:hypothetical protein
MRNLTSLYNLSTKITTHIRECSLDLVPLLCGFPALDQTSFKSVPVAKFHVLNFGSANGELLLALAFIYNSSHYKLALRCTSNLIVDITSIYLNTNTPLIHPSTGEYNTPPIGGDVISLVN